MFTGGVFHRHNELESVKSQGMVDSREKSCVALNFRALRNFHATLFSGEQECHLPKVGGNVLLDSRSCCSDWLCGCAVDHSLCFSWSQGILLGREKKTP